MQFEVISALDGLQSVFSLLLLRLILLVLIITTSVINRLLVIFVSTVVSNV